MPRIGAGRLGSDLVDEAVDEVDGRVVAVAAVAVRLVRGVGRCGGSRARREGALAEVEDDDRPGVVAERDEVGCLPPVLVPLPTSLASLSRSRSATSSPTLVFVSPVRRAMSARETGPRS